MRWIAKDSNGLKYMESKAFSWMMIPLEAQLMEVKIQGSHKTWEYKFRNGSGYYFIRDKTTYILGVIDKKRGVIFEYKFEKDGQAFQTVIKIHDFLEKINKDEFNSQIIREGIN